MGGVTLAPRLPRWRCRLSAKGRETFKLIAARNLVGTAWGRVSTDMVNVLWDGQKSAQRFHMSFIEKVEP
jgi:hypothetical protein